jgi:hypothetical protein
VEGYKARAKSAHLFSMDNGDLIGIERDEHAGVDTVEAISVFELPATAPTDTATPGEGVG